MIRRNMCPTPLQAHGQPVFYVHCSLLLSHWGFSQKVDRLGLQRSEVRDAFQSLNKLYTATVFLLFWMMGAGARGLHGIIFTTVNFTGSKLAAVPFLLQIHQTVSDISSMSRLKKVHTSDADFEGVFRGRGGS